jgi:hypothetical protein
MLGARDCEDSPSNLRYVFAALESHLKKAQTGVYTRLNEHGDLKPSDAGPSTLRQMAVA